VYRRAAATTPESVKNAGCLDYAQGCPGIMSRQNTISEVAEMAFPTWRTHETVTGQMRPFGTRPRDKALQPPIAEGREDDAISR